jgi:phospholipid/cholesterol/gamma-HCH transport system substrate-binding protein
VTPSPLRDLIVGLFVAAGLAAVAWLSLGVGGLSYGEGGGLVLQAAFDDIGGLKVRAPVVVSGVKVGQVTAIQLDDLLRARVTVRLEEGLELPEDTFAAIRTSGLLGDQFIRLEPGGSDVMLASGEEIAFTQNALALESLIDRFVTDFDSNDAGDGGSE